MRATSPFVVIKMSRGSGGWKSCTNVDMQLESRRQNHFIRLTRQAFYRLMHVTFTFIRVKVYLR